MMKLGGSVHCNIILPEFEYEGHSPPLGTHPQKCGVLLRRWENHRIMSTGYCFYCLFTGSASAVALHCCKAHSKSIGKMENSTPCKIVTPENFILKLGIRDYVENITHYTNFHVHRFSGGFSTNR